MLNSMLYAPFYIKGMEFSMSPGSKLFHYRLHVTEFLSKILNDEILSFNIVIIQSIGRKYALYFKVSLISLKLSLFVFPLS